MFRQKEFYEKLELKLTLARDKLLLSVLEAQIKLMIDTTEHDLIQEQMFRIDVMIEKLTNSSPQQEFVSIKRLNTHVNFISATLSAEEKLIFNNCFKRYSNILSEMYAFPTLGPLSFYQEKKGGANPGFNVQTVSGIKYTIKQGKTIGHTLAEAFTSKVLHGLQGIKPSSIAKSYLVTKTVGTTYVTNVETLCKERLWVASEWSLGLSFEAYKLFGFQTRPRAAGTFHSWLFEDLRSLNKTCQLRLESVVLAATFVADFDLHTENFILKIDTSEVEEKNKMVIEATVETIQKLITTGPRSTGEANRKKYLSEFKNHIDQMKELKADVFFHKIDHDHGYFLIANEKRKVDFANHHLGLFSGPTLHIAELTNATEDGFGDLILSDISIDIIKKNLVPNHLENIRVAFNTFCEDVKQHARSIAENDTKRSEAVESYLLREFYTHITGNKLTPTITHLADIQAAIYQNLVLGTLYKNIDLYSQIINHLRAKIKTSMHSPILFQTLSYFTEQLTYATHMQQTVTLSLTEYPLTPLVNNTKRARLF